MLRGSLTMMNRPEKSFLSYMECMSEDDVAATDTKYFRFYSDIQTEETSNLGFTVSVFR